MESIKIMVEEHENIKRMLEVIRKVSYEIMTLGTFDIEDMTKIIDFVRVYADEHHHGKEEDILFETMNREIKKLAESGAITGMYIEHDLGRLYMNNLEKALGRFKAGEDEARLDIIANAISYGDLLDRHIQKENTAMYKFAESMLDNHSKTYVEDECNKVEEEAKQEGLQDKYILILKELEKKYM